MKFSGVVFLLSLVGLCSSALLRNTTSLSSKKAGQAPTFQSVYASHTGRGAWKWNVALDAYQRHFSQFAARPGKMLEIGVQSGGSIDLYHAVLPQVHYYGMDINKNCVNFNDAQTTIYLGDQASVPVWTHFFSAITPSLDICIDDGGHQAHQMLATIQQVLPHMTPGGFFLTEDIHGINDDYLTKFFQPAAHTITGFSSLTGAQLLSVHMYPFVLGVQMVPAAGQTAWSIAKTAATVTVKDFVELNAALPQHLGGLVKLENAAWPNLFEANALANFFGNFNTLSGGVVVEDPPHCHQLDNTNLCTMIGTNTNIQNLVKGVHIYRDYAIVEVHQAPPVISALRKGDQWIPYNGPL